MANKIKKDDLVKVLSGKDKGKQEKVLEVLNGGVQVLVDNVNRVKKHTKPTQEHKGGIIEKVLPIVSAKVLIICPACKKATRVGFSVIKDKKVRICKKCSAAIDK